MTNASEPSRASQDAPADDPAAAENADDAKTAADAPPPSSRETVSEEKPSQEASAETSSAEEAAPPQGEALRAELGALREEHEETNDRLLRTAAELQNVRRRAAKEQRRRAQQARASTLRPMLEVLDDLQRALAAAEDGDEDGKSSTAFTSLKGGVEMVEEKFESALARLGVEPIAAEGEPFDESLHEAMMQQPAPAGTAPGTILAEIRRGYQMETSGEEEEERVLRHSRVVVAVASEDDGAAGDAAAEEDAGDPDDATAA